MVEEYIQREAPDIEARKLGLMDAAKALPEKRYKIPEYLLADLTQDQKDALKDAVSAALALYIRNTVVLETLLEKVSEIPELDHLTANSLADVLENFEVEVGSLLSVLMRCKNEESMALMDQTLARRRIDRIDEFGA